MEYKSRLVWKPACQLRLCLCGTLTESLAYELNVRMNVRSLWMSFDLPPSAVPHLKIRYVPNSMEYFARSGDGFSASMQTREGLDMLLSPENSVDTRKQQSTRQPIKLSWIAFIRW
jgi:hypothetical protein